MSALADSGAVHLCIPEHVALQLELRELERREVVLADGRRRSVPYMGPIEVRFANRRCFTGAMVLGDEVLLGGHPNGRHGPGAAAHQRESRQSHPAAERGEGNQPGSAAIRLPISIACRP